MAAAQPMITQWSPDKKHSDRERWICIYPVYLNSKKTRQQGRRMNKENCVENPTYQEIKDVLSATNLHTLVENKCYSREESKEHLFRGRIRVQLRNDDGTPVNSDYLSRDSLLAHIGNTIPKLKSRQGRAAEGSGQPQGSATSAVGATNKKAKGKRR